MTTGGITGLLDRGKILIRVHVLGMKHPDWRPVGIYPVPGSQIVGMTRQQKTRAKYQLQFWEKEAVTVSCRFILVFALFQFFRPDYLLAWNRLVGIPLGPFIRGKINACLSLDASQIRRKPYRWNGILRGNLEKTRLIEEQVLGAVLR